MPCLRPEAVHAGLLDDDAQDIDVHALHQGFLRGLRQQGGVVRMSAGVRSAARAGALWELRLDDDTTLRCHAVVNAAGAWADERRRPVRRRAGRPRAAAPHGIHVQAARGRRCGALAGRGRRRRELLLQARRRPAARLAGQRRPDRPHDVRPEEIDIATGIARIEAVSRLQIRRPTSTWAGLRIVRARRRARDRLGRRLPGFFWLAAQGGYGIQSAAGASELAAALLCGAPLPPVLAEHGVDPDALSPRRLR